MAGVLIVSQGTLAQSLFDSARAISGENPPFAVLTLDWRMRDGDIRSAMERAISGMSGRDGILVLTDLYGSTPANVAFSLMESHAGLEVLTGMNLPVLLALCQKHRQIAGAGELARALLDRGLKSMRLGSERPRAGGA
jgi:PTS system mannose-specific IIA component